MNQKKRTSSNYGKAEQLRTEGDVKGGGSDGSLLERDSGVGLMTFTVAMLDSDYSPLTPETSIALCDREN
ncbi:hypothetical protein Ancab_017845 [Ancistrocladus abbreviatus]